MSNAFLQHSHSCLEEGSVQPHLFSPFLYSVQKYVFVCLCSAKLLVMAAPYVTKAGCCWLAPRRSSSERSGRLWCSSCPIDGVPCHHQASARWLRTGPVACPGLTRGAQGPWWGLPQAVLCSCPFVLGSHQVPLQLLMRSGCRKEEALLVDCFCKKQAKMRRREGWAWCHRACPSPCPPRCNTVNLTS